MSDLERIVKQIEQAEPLDGVAGKLAEAARRATSPRPVKNALSGTWLGHQLHPALSDVPVGAWLMATALDWTVGKDAARAAERLVGLGVLAAVPTAASGASDWADTYGPEQRVGLVHAATNATATTLQVLSWSTRRRGHRLAGAALSTLGIGLTLGSAYLGGHLTLTRGVGVNHTAYEPSVADWTEVATLAELPGHRPVRVRAGDLAVVLVRQGEDVRALAATCTHAGGPLDEGTVEDGCIVCPWHRSSFRLSDGSVVRGPASVAAPTLATRIVAGKVQVRST